MAYHGIIWHAINMPSTPASSKCSSPPCLMDSRGALSTRRTGSRPFQAPKSSPLLLLPSKPKKLAPSEHPVRPGVLIVGLLTFVGVKFGQGMVKLRWHRSERCSSGRGEAAKRMRWSARRPKQVSKRSKTSVASQVGEDSSKSRREDPSEPQRITQAGFPSSYVNIKKTAPHWDVHHSISFP